MKCFQWLLIPVESIRDPRADDTSAPGGTRLASSAPPLPRHAILEHIQVTESGKKQVLGAITLLASQEKLYWLTRQQGPKLRQLSTNLSAASWRKLDQREFPDQNSSSARNPPVFGRDMQRTRVFHCQKCRTENAPYNVCNEVGQPCLAPREIHLMQFVERADH